MPKRERFIKSDPDEEELEELEELEKEKEKEKAKDGFILSSVMTEIEKEQAEEAEAEESPSYGDDSAGKDEEKKEEYIRPTDKEVLRQMEKEEMTAAEEKVKSIELKPEDEKAAKVQDKIRQNDSNPFDCPPDTDPDDFFNAEKKKLAENLAELIAVKVISNTIKSYKAADDDVDVTQLSKELLNEERIKGYKQDILARDDFTQMMDSVKDWQQLDDLRGSALEGNGGRVMDNLAKHRNEMINNDASKEVDRQMEIEPVREPRTLTPNQF